jgi:hypothetical protein
MAKDHNCETFGNYWIEFFLCITLIISLAFFIAFAVYFYKAKVYAEDNPTLNPVAPISKTAANIMMYVAILLSIISGIFVIFLMINLIATHKKSPLGKKKYNAMITDKVNRGKCGSLDKNSKDYDKCRRNKQIIESGKNCDSLWNKGNKEGYDLCEVTADNAKPYPDLGSKQYGPRHIKEYQRSQAALQQIPSNTYNQPLNKNGFN